jgi:DNA-binding MarR family transcriptional regulator
MKADAPTDPAAAPFKEHFSYRSWPFYWLARASGRYRASMEEQLKGTGLDMARWRVLMTLHEDRVSSVSRIAEHSSAKLPTMTKIVQRMEADGLIARRPQAGNEKISEVVLTDSGEQAGDEAWKAANHLYARAFSGMGEDEIATLNRLLERLADNLK